MRMADQWFFFLPSRGPGSVLMNQPMVETGAWNVAVLMVSLDLRGVLVVLLPSSACNDACGSCGHYYLGRETIQYVP